MEHVVILVLQANGFYTASPPLGYIPRGYTWYETLFLKYIQRHSQSHRITLYEYSRNGWTFHAKGLWYYPEGAQLPTMTIIGSSNYGMESRCVGKGFCHKIIDKGILGSINFPFQG